jgi:hypothetical protein
MAITRARPARRSPATPERSDAGQRPQDDDQRDRSPPDGEGELDGIGGERKSEEEIAGDEESIHRDDGEHQQEEFAPQRAPAVGSVFLSESHQATSISSRSISARLSTRHS